MINLSITPTLKKNHEKLSLVNVKFLEYVQQHPEWLDKNQFSRLLQWSDNTVIGTLHPWPLFISPDTSSEFKKASVGVFELIKTIPDRIFSFNPSAISKYYKLPEHFIHQCLYGITNNHITNFLARGDFIYSNNGLKCLEYNVNSSLGGMQSPFWEPLYLQIPLMKNLIKDLQLKINLKNVIANLIQHLVDVNLRWYPKESEINTIFLVYDIQTLALMSMSGQAKTINQLYIKNLKEKNPQLTGNVLFCLLEEIVKKDEYLFCHGKRVHSILDNLKGEEIPFEFLEVLKEENVSIYNGAISKVLSSKLNVAILSEHENSTLYSNQEQEIIKKYIPWTRKTYPRKTSYKGEEINLEDFVKSHKDLFVLKPSEGYGGKGIYIGKNTIETEWIDIVQKSFQEETWVVQENVSIPQLLFQYGENGCVEHDTVWGFYVFGNSFGGTWLRALPSKVSNGIVNAHKGAKMPIVIEMDQ